MQHLLRLSLRAPRAEQMLVKKLFQRRKRAKPLMRRLLSVSFSIPLVPELGVGQRLRFFGRHHGLDGLYGGTTAVFLTSREPMVSFARKNCLFRGVVMH
jgi:hypothetical protein